jgi:hypothetical protein
VIVKILFNPIILIIILIVIIVGLAPYFSDCKSSDFVCEGLKNVIIYIYNLFEGFCIILGIALICLLLVKLFFLKPTPL